ncbi:MAG TPA: GDP-mannose 4,6-dehydratase [Solirubrobacteraceae bacterium]|nr:GDP-mannose 4,6-dehydratase [Solirubrobacteraceae bacterium]
MPRRALITGISGQDGSYLAELMLAEGVEVHGVLRSAADATTDRLDAVRDAVAFHDGDLLERGTLRRIVAAVAPDEIYHLAAPTFVPRSWDLLADSMHGIATVTAELIEAVREEVPAARTVVATSREIFGPDAPSPQNEDTPCHPSSPYGAAKLAAHQLVGLIRERDGLHLSSAILFNHESPRRDPAFITRKVSAAVAAISLGHGDELVLGDTAAVRDWSAATDIVAALRLMAAAREPGDYVLASGAGHTVAELVEVAFGCVGLSPEGRVRVNPALVRPPESQPAIGNPRRARERLGWYAQTSFEELVAQMVAADLEELRRS